MAEAAVLIEESMPYRVNEEQKPISYFNRSPENLQRVRSARTHPVCSTDLSQAKVVQRLAYKVVASLEADLDSATDAKSRMNVAVAIRSAIQAWDLARDAARIARNKPLPGSLRPEAKVKKKKVQQSTFSEIPSSSSTSGGLTPTAKEGLTATLRQEKSASGMIDPESTLKSNSGAFGTD